MDMYLLLEVSRNQNGRIPISEILAVANNYELFGSKEQFVSIMQALDAAHNEYVEERRKKDERKHQS